MLRISDHQIQGLIESDDLLKHPALSGIESGEVANDHLPRFFRAAAYAYGVAGRLGSLFQELGPEGILGGAFNNAEQDVRGRDGVSLPAFVFAVGASIHAGDVPDYCPGPHIKIAQKEIYRLPCNLGDQIFFHMATNLLADPQRDFPVKD